MFVFQLAQWGGERLERKIVSAETGFLALDHEAPNKANACHATIKKLRTRSKDEVTRAATRAVARHGRAFRTITFDNGTEFHDYRLLEERLPVKVYFTTPYHSWERGSNENFNGLLRRYLPKGRCMSSVTQAHCSQIADGFVAAAICRMLRISNPVSDGAPDSCSRPER